MDTGYSAKEVLLGIIKFYKGENKKKIKKRLQAKICKKLEAMVKYLLNIEHNIKANALGRIKIVPKINFSFFFFLVHGYNHHIHTTSSTNTKTENWRAESTYID